MYLFDKKEAEHLHRTFLHSIITTLFVVLTIYLITTICELIKRRHAVGLPEDEIALWKEADLRSMTQFVLFGRLRLTLASAFSIGLGIGCLIHILLDIVMWFTFVDIVWPLSIFDYASVVNIWDGVQLPKLASIILTSSETILFSFYLTFIRVFTKRQEKKYQMTRGSLPSDNESSQLLLNTKQVWIFRVSSADSLIYRFKSVIAKKFPLLKFKLSYFGWFALKSSNICTLYL